MTIKTSSKRSVRRFAAVISCLTAFVWSGHAPAEPSDGFPSAQRHIHVIARHDGEVSLAASLSYLFYGGIPKAPGHPGLPGAKARAICDSLTDSERQLVPECVALQEFDAMKAGDMESRAQLFKPGEARSRAAAWLERLEVSPAEIAASWADAEVRFQVKMHWPDQVKLIYYIDGVTSQDESGHSHARYAGLRLQHDPNSGRFWCLDYNHQRATLFQTTFANIVNWVPGYNLFATTPKPPRGAAAWRIAPAPEGDTERRHDVRRIDASDPDAIGEHDFVLYIREDLLPGASQPFIFAEHDGFDETCRTLQRQLALTLAADDGGLPLEKCLEAWHPAVHEQLQSVDRFNRKHSTEKMRVQHSLVSFGGIPPSMIPEIRLVSRVVMDDAVVWYGWAPLRPAAGRDDGKRPYQPGPWGPAMTAGGEEMGVVHIVQRRDENGALRLTLPDAPEPDRKNPLAGLEEQLAIRVLNNDDLAKEIVRAHLEDERKPGGAK